jgi:hypothetical protein
MSNAQQQGAMAGVQQVAQQQELENAGMGQPDQQKQ